MSANKKQSLSIMNTGIGGDTLGEPLASSASSAGAGGDTNGADGAEAARVQLEVTRAQEAQAHATRAQAASVAALVAAMAQAEVTAGTQLMRATLASLPYSGKRDEYFGWSLRSRAELDSHDLVDVLETPLAGVWSSSGGSTLGGADELQESASSASNASGGEPKASALAVKRSKKVYAWLLKNVSMDTLMLMSDVPEGNAHEIWRRLRALNVGDTEMHKDQLQVAFHSCVQGDKSVAQYAAALRMLAVSLKQHNEEPKPSAMRFQFLKGLSERFRSLRESLRLHPGKSLTELVEIATGFENEHLAEAQVQQAHWVNSGAGATKATGGGASGSGSYGGGSGGGGRTKFEGECYHCQTKGHRKMECPKYLLLPQCAKCKKRGHAASTCYSGGAGGGGGGGGGGRSRAVEPQEAMSSTYYEAHMVSAESSAESATPSGSEFVELFLDSAASVSMVSSGVPLTGAETRPNMVIRVANGALLAGAQVGSLELETSEGERFSLPQVLTHAGLKANLLSVSAFCDQGKSVTYDAGLAKILHADGSVMLTARRVKGVYVVKAKVVHSVQQALAAEVTPQAQAELKLMHARLGHTSESSMLKLLRADAVSGLTGVTRGSVLPLCESCVITKSHRGAFTKRLNPEVAVTRRLERVWADLCGPFPTSRTGKHYLLLVVDEFSRLTWGWCLVLKSDAAGVLKAWMRAMKLMWPPGVVNFHSDNGGEFKSRDMTAHFEEMGITQTTTVVETPQHNGIVERKNLTVQEGVGAMLMEAGASKVMWSDAVLAFLYAHNRSTLRGGTSRTLEEMFSGAKPSLHLLREWGSNAAFHLPSPERVGKLTAPNAMGVFIGYDLSKKPPALLVLADGGRTVSARAADVKVDEGNFSKMHALTESYGPSDQTFEQDVARINGGSTMRLALLLSAKSGVEEAAKRAAAAAASAREESSAGVRAAEAQVTAPAVSAASSVPVSAVQQGGATPKVPAVGMRASRRLADLRAAIEIKEADDAQEEREEGIESESEETSEPHRRNPERANRGTLSHYGKVDLSDVDLTGLSAEVVARWCDLLNVVGEDSMHMERQLAPMLALAAQVSEQRAEKIKGGASRPPVPRNIAEMLASPDALFWLAALKLEHESMERHKVWVVVQLPAGKKAMPSKLVFKEKLDVDGNVAIFKVRLVAMGFHQREGVDYHETYAPTLMYITLRVFFAIVAWLDLDLDQFDVPTAFLNAPLTEEIYLQPPAGMEGFKLGQVCRLLKSMYGLKQAPRDFNIHINGRFVLLGFKACVADSCMYVKVSRSGRLMYLALFVDDVLPAYARVDKAEMKESVDALVAFYGIKKVAEAELVLGMRVKRDRTARTLTLDQEVYTRGVLEQAGMSESRAVGTPEEAAHSSEEGARMLAEASDAERAEAARALPMYASVVGQLLYAAVSTRPDIAHSVGILTRFLKAPTLLQWRAAKRVLRYLVGTAELGLVFGGRGADGAIVLRECYCDANWGGALDRRSTSAYVMKINGSTVSWASKKQQTVALSTCEAEYVSAGAAAQEIKWLRTLLEEMGHKQLDATPLLCDNQAAIALAKNDVLHSRVKHIDLRHHFIRELLANSTLRIHWVASAEQQADLLTKALSREIFERLRALVMGATPLRRRGAGGEFAHSRSLA